MHFVAVSALVFAVYHHLSETGAAQSPAPDASLHITVDEPFVDGLVQEAHRVSGRSVDREAALERWIHDEILTREAIRLGLGTHDAVVRQRLVQLAQLWLEANVQVQEPTEAQLRFVLQRDESRYRTPARIGFTHLFFSSARSQALDDVRARVRADYLEQRRATAVRAAVQRLRARYVVERR